MPLVELHPAAVPIVESLRERTAAYVRVLDEAAARTRALERMPALNRTVAEAALCFNAGLFFEAHEHLEHGWTRVPRGPLKRFLQGLIHISVGCHHARRGSYDGAINQFAKGLEKLTEAPGDGLGVDVDRLRREVEWARQTIMGRRREGMRPAALDELPRMRVVA